MGLLLTAFLAGIVCLTGLSIVSARRLHSRMARLESTVTTAEPRIEARTEPEKDLGSVGYVARLQAEWNQVDDEVRLRCWFAGHRIDNMSTATFPRRLACMVGSDELCDLKPVGDAQLTGSGLWQARLYTGSFSPSMKSRIWRAIRATMSLPQSQQPRSGIILADLLIRAAWEDDEPGHRLISLSPVGMTIPGGAYEFVVQIANWDGLPKTWRS